MEELKLENEENINEIESLRKQIEQLKNITATEQQQQQSRDLRRDESADLKTSHLTLDFNNKKSIMERQEGEVMRMCEICFFSQIIPNIQFPFESFNTRKKI